MVVLFHLIPFGGDIPLEEPRDGEIKAKGKRRNDNNRNGGRFPLILTFQSKFMTYLVEISFGVDDVEPSFLWHPPAPRLK